MNKALFAVPPFVGLLAVFAFAADPAWTPSADKSLCRDRDRSWNDRPQYCEVREVTLAPRGAVALDGAQNGGVEVRGESRSDIHVYAIVGATAETLDEAKAIAAQVKIATAPTIRADGPAMGRRNQWWVSYKAVVPEKTDLSLRAANGGIDISGVSGQIDFETVNGGVNLERVGGRVKGHTINGGLDIALTGTQWQGEGLDVETTNGGVSLSVPANYNAQIESGTVNGGVDTDFPMVLEPGRHRERNRKLSLTLGKGGPMLRATTTNGGVSIEKVGTR